MVRCRADWCPVEDRGAGKGPVGLGRGDRKQPEWADLAQNEAWTAREMTKRRGRRRANAEASGR
jgi:hypothetical protein